MNTEARAYVFNAAGLHPNSLLRTRNMDFRSLESRTSAFSSENEFLTYMNDTKDPEQQIANVKFLRRELSGSNRWIPDPMKIDHRNPEQLKGENDPAFKDDLQKYMKELDEKIADMERDRAAGRPLGAFPPVRAGQRGTIGDSMSWAGKRLGARTDGPNLGKLAQRPMSNVLDPMKANLEKDRATLKDFIRQCGLSDGQ